MIETDAEALLALRYHLNEVLEVLESHNQWMVRFNKPSIRPDKVEAGRKASEEVEKYIKDRNAAHFTQDATL